MSILVQHSCATYYMVLCQKVLSVLYSLFSKIYCNLRNLAGEIAQEYTKRQVVTILFEYAITFFFLT